jgi:hypothetical protein
MNIATHFGPMRIQGSRLGNIECFGVLESRECCNQLLGRLYKVNFIGHAAMVGGGGYEEVVGGGG